MNPDDVIRELKKIASDRGYEFSKASIDNLVAVLKPDSLDALSEHRRSEFYQALLSVLDRQGTYSEDRTPSGKLVLHEPDADAIINWMKSAAAQRTLPKKIREVWCAVFIGGCP